MATAEELRRLRTRIGNLLMGRSVQRINFRIGGVNITPGGFTVIGMSLLTADIPSGPGRRAMSVEVSSHLPSHAAAAYEARTNAIRVPRANYGMTVEEAVTLVHESVHAICDFNNLGLNAMREEAAAYIADAMYSAYLFIPAGGGTRIETVARTIADDLIAQAERTPGLRPEVTQAQLTELCNRVHAHRGYHAIPRRSAYLHNGGTL